MPSIIVKNLSFSLTLKSSNLSTFLPNFYLFKKKKFHSIINNLSFDVKQNEKLAIVGSNGSGKTTLLKLLAGIYKPSSGSIFTNGLINNAIELGYGVYPYSSGKRNIELQGLIYGLRGKPLSIFIDKVIEFASIGNLISEPWITYSQGMKSRIKAGITITKPADIILMDEWLNAGDKDFKEKLKNEFDIYSKNKIIIFTSHDEALASKLSTRFIKIKKQT